MFCIIELLILLEFLLFVFLYLFCIYKTQRYYIWGSNAKTRAGPIRSWVGMTKAHQQDSRRTVRRTVRVRYRI